MDYLEGALMGKFWTDTDYENRRHRAAALLGSLVFWLYGFYLMYYQNFIGSPRTIRLFFIWFILSAALFLVSPILCYVYYNLALPLRWLSLLLQALKYLFSFLFLYALFVPFVLVDRDKMVTRLMNVLNGMVGNFFAKGHGVLDASTLIFHAIWLALLGMLIVFLIFCLLSVIPYLYLEFLHFVQYSIDQAFVHMMRGVRRSRSGRATTARQQRSSR